MWHFFADTALSASRSFSQDASHAVNREGNGLWSPHRTFQQVDDARGLPFLSLPGELPFFFAAASGVRLIPSLRIWHSRDGERCMLLVHLVQVE